MSELLLLTNFDRINVVEITELDADAAVGATTITLKNAQGYTDDEFIRIGEGEGAEIRQIDSVTGLVATLTVALTLEHKKFEKITKIRGNQIKVYRAANVNGTPPSDSDFASIATLTIEADQDYTEYTDSSGSSSYWYKKTFYNLGNATETPLSAVDAIRGGDYGALVGIDEILDESGFAGNAAIADTDVATRRAQTDNEILSALRAMGYSIPLKRNDSTEFVPPLVANIARLLGAGYLMKQNFVFSNAAIKKKGDDKMKEARDLLAQLRKQDLVLLDESGNVLLLTNQVSGWPDDSTKDVGSDGYTPQPFQSSITKRF